jgi:hypothetical protein
VRTLHPCRVPAAALAMFCREPPPGCACPTLLPPEQPVIACCLVACRAQVIHSDAIYDGAPV